MYADENDKLNSVIGIEESFTQAKFRTIVWEI